MAGKGKKKKKKRRRDMENGKSGGGEGLGSIEVFWWRAFCDYSDWPTFPPFVRGVISIDDPELLTNGS
ncbi:hypothetical protein ACLOJK_029831 [Asimina triloba]